MISYDGGRLHVTLTRKTGLAKLARLLEAEAELGLHETATVVYKCRTGALRQVMPIQALAEMVKTEVDAIKQLRIERAVKVGM
ncbi:hypothetical protein DWB77_02095 [Streptomyces hundungensis]|uniref:Uncharacterized protein n=1 Tax=Streptomyces hundungensis TaxID=1077946 RepID=A0A387H817_9ACTN|nr:hypothetical protein [Streptomyces hundungensis]AYG79976.1 hypothetical protein DWB77_02095 [Streptomyces hundungensis]